MCGALSGSFCEQVTTRCAWALVPKGLQAKEPLEEFAAMAASLAAPLEILARRILIRASQGSAALLTFCFENPTEVQGGRVRMGEAPL